MPTPEFSGPGAAAAHATGNDAGHAAESSDVLRKFQIEPAIATDVPAIAALLRDANLPHEDFAPHVAHFLVARAEGEVVGAIGAEVCGEVALLRSLVVAPRCRGVGLGSQLCDALERAGGGWGVRQWWLLTTTAETFFTARGFLVVPRTKAPAAIADTAEFRGLCPSIATCLTAPVGGRS